MIRGVPWITAFVFGLLPAGNAARASEPSKFDPAVFGVFVGSTPCGESLVPLLKLPAGSQPPLQWTVTLRQDPRSRAATRYEVRCTCKVAENPNAAGKEVAVTKTGIWKRTTGTKSNAARVVYELDGLVALAEVDRNVVHLLDGDRKLMLGDGGFSYTIYRAEAAEPLVDPSVVAGVPDMSYSILPLASGDDVLGVFEGRTPFQGIARQLKLKEHAAGFKAKWRVTLFQDPRTREPTTYRIEGTLFRSGAREGQWKIARGTAEDSKAVIIELAATKTQPALTLLQADDNVLFLLDPDRRPLVGHSDFSYTLSRRATPDE
jgi:hypothetical protein